MAFTDDAPADEPWLRERFGAPKRFVNRWWYWELARDWVVRLGETRIMVMHRGWLVIDGPLRSQIEHLQAALEPAKT